MCNQPLPGSRVQRNRNNSKLSFARAFFLCQEQDLLERAGFLCQEQDLLGKIRVSLPRARSPWQDQGFFAKRKISSARSGFLCQEKDLLGKIRVSLPRERSPCQEESGNSSLWKEAWSRAMFLWQGQSLIGKSKVSLARAEFLWQEQSFLGKSKISLTSASTGYTWFPNSSVKLTS